MNSNRTSVVTVKLAPRVLLYAADAPSPAVQDNWLALPQQSQEFGTGVVFGDGSHPTTRLCAAAVDMLCRQQQPRAVLDVGTGTGILARIARARGAPFVVGTDIEPAALVFARAQAGLDRHAVEIHYTSEAPDHWGARFDLVVANILAETLGELASRLCGALVPGGTLLLSGLTPLQAPPLRLIYERLGLVFLSQSLCEEWVVLRAIDTRNRTNVPSPIFWP